VNAPFSRSAILDLLLRAQALCIQKALGRRVIRVGGREKRSLGLEQVT
jgi:hypothetical protein